MKTERNYRTSIKGCYTKWLNESKDDFNANKPRYRMSTYNTLIDTQERYIKGLKRDLEQSRSACRFLADWNRQLTDNIAPVRIDEPMDIIDFDTYNEDEDVTCPICCDSIKKNQHIYRCVSCNVPLHSHCTLYLKDKNKCPCCRQKFT